MSRKGALSLLAATPLFSQRVTIELPGGKAKDAPGGVFTADWRNIAMHYNTPQWFKDAKIENLQVQNARSVVRSLVNNISRNGNLCLNISPKADGTIPENQQKVLREVGAWLKANGEGVYGSHAWTTDAEGSLRFTANNDCVYVFALDSLSEGLMIKSLASGSGYRVKEVCALATGAALDFEQTTDGLKVQDASSLDASGLPTVFRIVLTPVKVLFIGDSITDGSWGCSKGSAINRKRLVSRPASFLSGDI